MNIDDERERRARLGLGRVVIVLALVWLAITGFGFVMDLVHRVLVVALVAVVVFVVVKVSNVTKRPRHEGQEQLMWKAVKRWWKYFAMKLHVLHEEKADPKVQIEQAIQEAKESDRRLRDQAANVIAHQKQAQTRLDKTVAEYERANVLAEQALVLSDHKGRTGDAAESVKLDGAAESLAGRVITLEREIGELEQQLLRATAHADQARAAVEQNGAELKKRLAEKEELLNKLDRAKVQEEMNKALEQLSQTVGGDVPTFAEVTNKIDKRLAKAEAVHEINAARIETSTESIIQEVERAQQSSEAQAWLSERRAKLGLSSSARVAHDGQAEATAP